MKRHTSLNILNGKAFRAPIAVSLALVLSASVLSTPVLSTQARAAQADFITRLKACKATDSIVSRASCYDDTLEEYNLDTLDLKTKADSKWKVSTTASSMPGLKNIIVTGDANARYTASDGSLYMPNMTVRCIDGKADAYILWGSKLGWHNVTANSTVGVNGGVQASNWQVSTDGQTTYIDNPHRFLIRAISASPYTVKIWPSSGSTYTASFDTATVKDSLKQIKTACFPGDKNWQAVTQPSGTPGVQNVAVTGYAEDHFTAVDGTTHLPSLTLRCIDGKADGYVIWGSDVGLPVVAASTSFDNQAPISEQWPASTDGKSTFLPDVASFLKRSDGANGSFAVTITSKMGPYAAAFDLDGFAAKVKLLRKACHI